THHVFEVNGPDSKKDLIEALASGTGRRILFMRTKHHAKKLAKQLTDSGIPSADLHGNLSQPQRDRNLAAFSDGSARVLVATDVAARGVHVDDVELVVHVDPPMEHKAYLHRSGRTARAGNAGDVVTVVLPEQRRDTRSLLHKAGIRVEPQLVSADSAAVRDLVGEIAPYQRPAPVAAPAAAPNGSKPRRRSGGGANGGRGGSRSGHQASSGNGSNAGRGGSRSGHQAPAAGGGGRGSRGGR